MELTSNATSVIRKCLAREQDYVRANDLVPIIVWIYNRDQGFTNAGPVLGMIERQRVESIEPEIYSEDDLIVYNGLPNDLRARFERCVLDFRDGYFEFIA